MVVAGLLCSLLGLLCPNPNVEVTQVDNLPPVTSTVIRCLFEPDPGHCEAFIQRYYFDSSKGKCKTFTYGGCGGNQNNFESEYDCLQSCNSIVVNNGDGNGGKGQKAQLCSLAPEPGPCEALFPRFYYDPKSETCKKFIYGGCRGNENNFMTVDDCIEQCGSFCLRAPDPGPCRGSFLRFFYDPESKECKQFIYGGCVGNNNNFKTKESCITYCGHIQDKTGGGGGEEAPAVSDNVCTLELDRGTCRAAVKRFYHDAKTGKCKEFIYGGCRGNDNNFITEEDCIQQCGGEKVEGKEVEECDKEDEEPDSICSLDPDRGPCKASQTRYYFNSGLHTCQTFTFGGCEGNANNFETLEECHFECA